MVLASDRQTGGQTDKQTDRETDRHIYSQMVLPMPKLHSSIAEHNKNHQR